MSGQLINLGGESSDEEVISQPQKHVVDDFDPFAVNKHSDLMYEIQSEMQNGSSYSYDDDSALHTSHNPDTSSDINSLIQHNDLDSDSQLNEVSDLLDMDPVNQDQGYHENGHDELIQVSSTDDHNGVMNNDLIMDHQFHGSLLDNGPSHDLDMNNDSFGDHGNNNIDNDYFNHDSFNDNLVTSSHQTEYENKNENNSSLLLDVSDVTTDDSYDRAVQNDEDSQTFNSHTDDSHNINNYSEERSPGQFEDDEPEELRSYQAFQHHEESHETSESEEDNVKEEQSDSTPLPDWGDGANVKVDVDHNDEKDTYQVEYKNISTDEFEYSDTTPEPNTSEDYDGHNFQEGHTESFEHVSELSSNRVEDLSDDFAHDQHQAAHENSSFFELTKEDPHHDDMVYEVKTVSEDDMTKSPSCSESEEEEVIQDGEVIYKTNDEEHISEFKKEVPKYRDDFITGSEPGDIGNRLTVFEDYERTHSSQTEQVVPGKLHSPFIEGGLEENRNAVERDQIQFAEMSNVRNRFETGEMDHNHQNKAPRSITPPRDYEKTEYCNDDIQRDPNVVRSDDILNEEENLPKVGSSQQILQRFQEVSSQQRDYRPKHNIREEIASSTQVEYENEPERFEQWQNKTEGGIYESEPAYNPDVVRATDVQDYEAELPEIGYTRNVLQKFKNIEKEDHSQPKPSRREITPPSNNRIEFSNEPQQSIQVYEGRAEAGIFESQPQVRADVVHADQYEEIVAPERGYAKNVANMFKQMSSAPSTPTRSNKEFTPPREDSQRRTVLENRPSESDAIRESDAVEDIVPSQGSTKNMAMRFQQMSHESSRETHRAPINIIETTDSGVYESTPQVLPEVVHSDDFLEEALPEQGLAKNLVAQFRQMESGGNDTSSNRNYNKEFTPPRAEPRIDEQRENIRQQRLSSGHGDGVAIDVAVDGGVFESEPQVREDVMREADTDYDEGLPTRDTTKNLLARFQNIQKQAVVDSETPVPIKRKEKVSRFRAVQLEKCDACSKTVYFTERFEFNKCIYHKTCFKCSHCRRPLTPATYAVNENTLYCMNHYKQMFKAKGNYDEGFGRTEYKKRWQSEPNLSSSNEEIANAR